MLENTEEFVELLTDRRHRHSSQTELHVSLCPHTAGPADCCMDKGGVTEGEARGVELHSFHRGCVSANQVTPSSVPGNCEEEFPLCVRIGLSHNHKDA